MNKEYIVILPETGENLDLVTALRLCVFAEEVSHRAFVNSWIDREEGEEYFKEQEKAFSAPRNLIWTRIEETLEGESAEKEKRIKRNIKTIEERSREEILSVFCGASPEGDIDWDQLLN